MAMLRLFSRIMRKGRVQGAVMNHNQVDATVMGRIVGMTVLVRDFALVEDHLKPLGDGVTWRRRRFTFRVADDGAEGGSRPEALCINEITLDSGAPADICPVLAADYPHLVHFPEIENAYWATTLAKGALRSGADTRESRLYVDMSPAVLASPGEDVRDALIRLAQVEKSARRPAGDDAVAPLPSRFVDLGDGKFGVARYLPAFPPSRLVQSSEDILAATNAGYFLNFPEEYDDGVSALHQPVGGHMTDGRLAMPPWVARPGIMGFAGAPPTSGIYGPEALEICIEGLASVPLHRGATGGATHGAVWRAFDNCDVPAPDGAAQVTFCGAVPVRIEPAHPGTRPPHGGAIVLLEGEHARAALSRDGIRRLSVRIRTLPQGEPRWLISAGPFLVRNGAAAPAEAMLAPDFAGEFRPAGPPPTRFPYDVETTRAPRTAFGTLPSGGLKIVIVDGRRSGEHSCGVTLGGLSHLMQWVGCDSAVNLDGGGSSVLAVEGATAAEALLENGPLGVVNIPSDQNGTERIVPVLLIVRGKR